MAKGILTPAQRRRIAREMASDVAQVIADIETVEVEGNVYLAKPSLVAALAHYFAETGCSKRTFIGLAYSGLFRP
jgi:hypothetical protein